MKIGKKILLLSSLIILVGTVIFSALIFIDYSLVIGWLIGSISMLGTFSLSLLAIKFLLKNSEFQKGMWLTYLRIFIIFMIHIGIIIGIVAIDKSVSGYGINDISSVNVMNNPINIFTYIGGVSVVSISTLIAHIFIKREERNG